MVDLRRYTLDNLIDAVRNPRIFLGEAYRIGFEANRQLQRYENPPQGDRVADEDWDTLLILDACRFDMFSEQNYLDGRLETRCSLGSESREFLQSNFGNGTFHDIVYITANPYATTLPDGTFHAVVNLLEDGWDDELQTVHPETVVNAVKDADDRFPNKRLIVHFMQPHYPFIGEFGQQLGHKGIDNPLTQERNDETPREIWGSLGHGRVEKEDVWKAYRENLDLVLPYAEEVIAHIPGKTVITADHGNLVGERTRPLPVRGYGHPRGFVAPELRTVPWFVVDGNERRPIEAESPVETDSVADDVLEDRLTALGYR